MNDKKAKSLRGITVLGFLKLWRRWKEEFPNNWVLMTLTTEPHECHRDGYALRLWFGEPHSFRRDFVDSMGHNLIVGIYGSFGDLQELADEIAPSSSKEFERSQQNGVVIWRRVEQKL